MIYQNDKNENTQNQFSNALKELQIGKLLRNSNITKSCGVSAYEVFQFLLLLVFQGRNLFRFLTLNIKTRPFQRIRIIVFLMKLPITGADSLCSLQLKLLPDLMLLPDRNG